MITRVVEVLDAASNAAWDCRGKAQAITAAQQILYAAPAAESAAAFTAWFHAVGYDGPLAEFETWLTRRYKDRGDIGISLTRAAFIVEQGERS